MERKVVITGMGIWSCLGKTLEDVRDSLYTGKSALSSDRNVKMPDSVPHYVQM